MNPRLSTQRNAAMTLFEVGVVIAIVMVLVILLLPRITMRHRSISRAPEIACMNNLKQIGLAYKIWEGDHGDVYPMGISVTNGGSMETVAAGNVVQTFLVMSNELSTPRLLICPADSTRRSAMDFAGLSLPNISYFVGADVTNDVNPQMILSGDANFELAGVPVKSGLRSFWTNDPVAWSATRHVRRGNIGLNDGSVQTVDSSRLRDLLQQTGFATNRFAIP